MNITELCNKYASGDTTLGTDKSTTHQYAQYVYDKEFKPLKNEQFNLLEVGVSGGHSLLIWSEYFTNATIYGIDITDSNFNAYPIPENVYFIVADGTKPNTFANLPKFKVIIDDGSHLLQHQLATFKIAFPLLEDGGLFIIEDIADFDQAKEAFDRVNPNYEVYDLRDKSGRHDDIIFLYRK